MAHIRLESLTGSHLRQAIDKINPLGCLIERQMFERCVNDPLLGRTFDRLVEPLPP
jgi:hypothetical protein